MADVLAVWDEYRAQTWVMLIQKCNRNRLTKWEFCQQRGISGKSFYYWLQKLRSQMAKSAGSQLVQLDPEIASEDVLLVQYRGAERDFLPVWIALPTSPMCNLPCLPMKHNWASPSSVIL